MARVFISYRRADSATATGRIYDRLVQRFGKKHIFKDVDDIPPGVNFATFIQNAVRQCSVMLVVIGREWLAGADAGGKRRLDDPADYVRIEIEAGLARGLPIIPLLVEGAEMPHRADLPPTLQPLALINALPVRDDPDFSRDMERVASAIGPLLARRASPSGILARLRPRPSTPAPSSSAATPSAPTPSSASGVGVPASPSRSAVTAPAPAPPRADASAALPGQSQLSGAVSPVGEAKAPPERPAAGSAAADSAPAALPRPGHAHHPPPRALLLATLASVLVVASLGILLSAQVGLPPFGSDVGATNAAGTRRANSASTAAVGTSRAYFATYYASQTASQVAYINVLFPYTASAPGPDCDSGPARWRADGAGSPLPAQRDIVMCSSDRKHTTLVARPTKAGDGSYYGETIVSWSLTDQPMQLPSTVTFSITVTNRTSDMMSELDVEAASTHYLMRLYAPGYHGPNGITASGYEADRCGGSQSQQICTGVGADGSYQTTGTHTLTISVNGPRVTFKIDKTTIGSYPEASRVTPQSVAFDIDNYGTTQSCSADFADFQMHS